MARKSNAKLVRIVVVAVFAIVAIGLVVMQTQAARKVAAETAAAWMITGPACPVPATGAPTPPLTHPNALEDAAIVREVQGAVACNTIKENGDGATLGICQYIAPGAMKITTPKGTYSFAPPRGVDASLIVRDGVPSCVEHANPDLFLKR